MATLPCHRNRVVFAFNPVVHAFNPSPRKDYKMGEDSSQTVSFWDSWRQDRHFRLRLKWESVVGCFAFWIFRLNPNFWPWVFISYASQHGYLRETLPQNHNNNNNTKGIKMQLRGISPSLWVCSLGPQGREENKRSEEERKLVINSLDRISWLQSPY